VSGPQDIPVAAASLRVRVNRELCQGHVRCVALAPELFDVDGVGEAREIGGGKITPDLEKNAWLAWANCPERAIEIEQPGEST
jgi:ferredoxin